MAGYPLMFIAVDKVLDIIDEEILELETEYWHHTPTPEETDQLIDRVALLEKLRDEFINDLSCK